MPRVAAIDCGTNSIRLLVAELTERHDGTFDLRDLHREMRIVRLGQGVDASGRLAPEALARTRAGRTTVIAVDRKLDEVNECIDDVLAGRIPARVVFEF